jgi:hypothetical protein
MEWYYCHLNDCEISEYNKCHTSAAQELCHKCCTDGTLDMDNLPPRLHTLYLWYDTKFANKYKCRFANLPYYLTTYNHFLFRGAIHFTYKDNSLFRQPFYIMTNLEHCINSYGNYTCYYAKNMSGVQYMSLQCTQLWHDGTEYCDYISQSVRIILYYTTLYTLTYNDNLPIYLVNADDKLDDTLKHLIPCKYHKYNPLRGNPRNLPIQYR